MGDGDKAPALPLETLLALGLDQRTAENALVNAKVTANLAAVIAEVSSRSVPLPVRFQRMPISTSDAALVVSWLEFQFRILCSYRTVMYAITSSSL